MSSRSASAAGMVLVRRQWLYSSDYGFDSGSGHDYTVYEIKSNEL